MQYSALSTDLYELTMLAGYLDEGMAEHQAVFDLFFRTNPFGGGYAIFAGLRPALEYLEQLCFRADELDYLQGLGLFNARFIEFLRQFRFRGTVTAPPEGSVVFAGEPLLTVEGTLAEVQFVETALLNIINFQTLVATKAARISDAAGEATVIEFGLRRAQGPDGGLSVARAACVGGICSTSNVLAGMRHKLPLRGTHAHSWIQAFPDELTAFRVYASAFPDNTILLVDTYNTLLSGVPNAIIVAGELRAQGHRLQGIRLDSGDTAQLSREARRMLDQAGFPEVKIVASNDLDEYAISAIRAEGGQVDIYGVGTRLAVCDGFGGGALNGVYKLVESQGLPRMKLTCDQVKATLPGKKRLLRAFNSEGTMQADLLCLHGERFDTEDRCALTGQAVQDVIPDAATFTDLRQAVMCNGQPVGEAEPLSVLSERCRRQLSSLPPQYRCLHQPQQYPLLLSSALRQLSSCLPKQFAGKELQP